MDMNFEISTIGPQTLISQSSPTFGFMSGDRVKVHIVPQKKFDKIGGTSSLTFPNFKYGGPREICVERNCFDSPNAK